jgi:hypothetical protein
MKVLDSAVRVRLVCGAVDLQEYTVQARPFRFRCEIWFLRESDAVRGDIEPSEPELPGIGEGLQEVRR